MASNSRIDKVNDLIRDNLSKIIQKELDKKPGVFVSVAKVETAADLKSAKIFISIFPDGVRLSTFSKLKRLLPAFQKKLAQTLRMKFTPKIFLILDDTQRKVSQMEELFQKIAQERKDDSNC